MQFLIKFVTLVITYPVFLVMKNLSTLKENVLTIYGGATELVNTILVFNYMFLQATIYAKTPNLYHKLAPLRRHLSIRSRRHHTKVEG